MDNDEEKRTSEEEGSSSRRHFFSLIGWGSLIASIGGSVLASIRFFFPNVLFEPPRSFKIGKLDDYPEGTAMYLEEHVLYVFHKDNRVRCISAVCTHVGCTVSLDEAYNKFRCPCHGSIFDMDGKVLDGPAPRPLEWFKVILTGDEDLLVDKDEIVDSNYYFEV